MPLRAGSFQRPSFQHPSHTSGNQGWILRPLFNGHGGRREPDFPSKACFWMENLSRPISPGEVSQFPFRGSLVQLRAGSFQRPGFQHHSHTSGNQGWILRPLTRFGDPGPDFETPLTLWAPGAEFSNPSHTLGARGWIWRPLPHFGCPGPDLETPHTLWAPPRTGEIFEFFLEKSEKSEKSEKLKS